MSLEFNAYRQELGSCAMENAENTSRRIIGFRIVEKKNMLARGNRNRRCYWTHRSATGLVVFGWPVYMRVYRHECSSMPEGTVAVVLPHAWALLSQCSAARTTYLRQREKAN